MKKLKNIITILIINVVAFIGYLLVSIPINFCLNEPSYCFVENFPKDFAVGLPYMHYQFLIDGEIQHGSVLRNLFINLIVPMLLVLIFFSAWWLLIMPAENDNQKRMQKILKGKVKLQILVTAIPFVFLTFAVCLKIVSPSIFFSLIILYLGHVFIYMKYDAMERKSLEMKDDEDEEDVSF